MRNRCSVVVAASVVASIADNVVRWLDRCLIDASISPNLHLMSDRRIFFCLDRRLKSVAVVAAVQSMGFAASDTIAVADESMSQESNHWNRNAMQFLRCQPMFHSMNWNVRLKVTSVVEN